MKWLKPRTVVRDERIEHTRNRIYKEAYNVIAAICCVSIAVKLYLYGADIGTIVTELVILVGSSLYTIVRSVMLGIYSDEVEVRERTSKFNMTTKNILAGLTLGVAIAVFFGVRSAVLYADDGWQSVWYFLTVFAVTLMIYIPVLVLVLTVPHEIANQASKKAGGSGRDSDEPR